MASDSRVADSNDSNTSGNARGAGDADRPEGVMKSEEPKKSDDRQQVSGQAQPDDATRAADVAESKPDARSTEPAKTPRPKTPAKAKEPVPAAAAPGTEARAKSARKKSLHAGQKKQAGKRTPDAPESTTPPGAPTPPAPSDDDSASTEGAADETKTPVLAGSSRFLLFQAVPSWLVSMLVHAALLMVLALITLPDQPPDKRIVAVANPTDIKEIETPDMEEIDLSKDPVFSGPERTDEIAPSETPEEFSEPSIDDLEPMPESFRLDDMGDKFAPSNDLMQQIGNSLGKGLGEQRGEKGRKGLVEKNGGSAGSEAAVALALEWLAAHQLPDGGWNFNHQIGPCNGRCGNPGDIPPARNGATAMALLPFLGAGQTHKEGKYKQNVEAGLKFLVKNMKPGTGWGNLSDSGGQMYSHGLGAITLCEAYAMTNDPSLMQPAQMALNFIVYAQDPIGGGWRYQPRQPGDTSVVGWQLMACKSGHMAYLKVPGRTILGVNKFLDFVQVENGAKYGYTFPAAGPATTAVGLLCRMYLGWKHDEPALKAGVEYLHQTGPLLGDRANMYFNYYATQVMRHYEGPFWEEWNKQMRDPLVSAQDLKGHAKGSWYFPREPWALKGGRLYCTSLATMILEVYYRHLPIYGKQAAEDEFPL